MTATVIKFRRPKNETIRGVGRQIYSDALKSVPNPRAIAIVVLGSDGTYACRMTAKDEVSDFDVYSRAGAIMDRQKMSLLEDR